MSNPLPIGPCPSHIPPAHTASPPFGHWLLRQPPEKLYHFTTTRNWEADIRSGGLRAQPDVFVRELQGVWTVNLWNYVLGSWLRFHDGFLKHFHEKLQPGGDRLALLEIRVTPDLAERIVVRNMAGQNLADADPDVLRSFSAPVIPLTELGQLSPETPWQDLALEFIIQQDVPPGQITKIAEAEGVPDMDFVNAPYAEKARLIRRLLASRKPFPPSASSSFEGL